MFENFRKSTKCLEYMIFLKESNNSWFLGSKALKIEDLKAFAHNSIF